MPEAQNKPARLQARHPPSLAIQHTKGITCLTTALCRLMG